MLIDTHCHLDSESCEEGADAVIDRARAAGVVAVVCIGVGGLDAARQATALAARRSDVVATVGVHPHDAQSADEELLVELDALMGLPEVVAVGEVGLDYHYDNSPRQTQRAIFRRFIETARLMHKPLVIHTRSAAHDTLELLESGNARDVGGVIHCFSEDKSFAQRALDLGFDLSFSGIVTFKNARAVHEVAAWAPEDRILIETDSPYLAPVPHRGRRNEPAFVSHTLRELARLRQAPVERLARATTENACRRFGPRLAEALAARHDEG